MKIIQNLKPDIFQDKLEPFKGIDHQQTILRLLHKCITPMYSSLFK